MSIYQCQKCGCAENTATGNYHQVSYENWKNKENKPLLCSFCSKGEWHNLFGRMFFPKNSCFTNNQGNLEHKETGLVGNSLYEELGRPDEYEGSATSE